MELKHWYGVHKWVEDTLRDARLAAAQRRQTRSVKPAPVRARHMPRYLATLLHR